MRTAISNTLGILVALGAVAFFARANVLPQIFNRYGEPITVVLADDAKTITVFPARTSPTGPYQRHYGCPSTYRVRSNWVRFQSDTFVFDGQMRPHDDSIYLGRLAINGVTLAATLMLIYYFTTFAATGRISLRGVLILVFCSAMLIRFVLPYVNAQYEIRRQQQAFRISNSCLRIYVGPLN